MRLTNVEISSGLWNKLVDHYTPILAKTRLRAENPAVSEAERIPLLHKIAFIKDLLAMAEQEEDRKIK
jgi:hypothetical protein